ncbi:hypothetical protein [Desulfovibrio sp.]|uniref:hypothetical protein n=1 Tax=Desulfovibrio sp. TaxID=885 RepID=UPI003AB34B9F
MTVRELVVKLVLNALGFQQQVQDAQKGLDKLGTTAKQATETAARGMDTAADSARDLGTNARQAGTAVQQAGERGARGFDGLLGVLGKVGLALGGLAAIQGTISDYVQSVAEIEKTSDMLGMSMEAWQGWAYAAQQAGLEAEDVRDRLMDLGDWMLDLNVNDSGPLKDFAEKTKTSFKDAKGATVSMEEGLLRLADAAQKMDRQTATSWLQQIGFDEKSTPLILKGRKAIEEYIRTGKEQALYSKRDAENARRMRQAWQGVVTAYKAVSGAVLRALGPAFDVLADKLTSLAAWVRENETSLVIVLGAVASVITVALTPALWGMATAAAAALWPFAPLILAALALGVALDDLWAFASGGNSVLENLLRRFGMTDESIERLRGSVRAAIGFFRDLWTAITGDGADSAAAFARIQEQIASVARAVSNFIRSIGTWIDGLLPQWVKDLLAGDSKAPAKSGGNAAPAAPAYDGLAAAASGGFGGPFGAGDMARPQSGPVTNNRNVTTSIGQITVQTQATDADGIAGSIGDAMRNQTAQADGAFGA